MWKQKGYCIALLVWALCLRLYPQSPGYIALSQEEAAQIRGELQSMRMSLNVLRQSQKASGMELLKLLNRCEEAEGLLNQALASLDQSGNQLIYLQENRKELEEVLSRSREAYAELSAYCQRLKRENTLLKWAIGGTAALAAGCAIAGAAILLQR